MINQYNSLIGTFVGADAYNLPLSVVPPADLALSIGLFSPRFLADRNASSNNPVCKFRISENPYIRTFGLYANLADGLVNGASRQGWDVRTNLRRYATPIRPGTITISKGSATVTGVGTDFAASWVGKPIGFYDDAGIYQTFDVLAVASTTSMTLAGLLKTAVTAKRFTQQNLSLTGTIANVAGSATLTGTGTLFTTELCPGATVMWLDDNYNVREGVVSVVTDNTTLTLTAATTNTANSMFFGVATTAGKLYILVQATTSTTLQLAALNNLFTQSYPAGSVTYARPIRGLLTIPAATQGGANVTVTGYGTKFLSDVVAGQTISYYGDNGSLVTVKVQTVTTDTSMTIYTPPVAGSATAGVALALTKGQIVWTDAFWALRADIVMDMALYTISIDPAYGASSRRLSFSFIGEVEHNVQLMDAL